MRPAPVRSGAGFFVAGFDRFVGFGWPIHFSFRIGAPPSGTRQKDRGFTVTLLKKLQNPYALVLQGFLVGGLLFWTTQGDAAAKPQLHATSIVAVN